MNSRQGKTLVHLLLLCLGAILILNQHAAAQSLPPQNLESGLAGWTMEGGVWEIGDPFGGRKPHGGSKCLGTDLDGHYPNNAAARLISPTFTVPSDNARLRFWQDMDIEPGDTGYVQISVNQGAWTTLPSNSRYSGVTQQWTYTTVELSGYANQNVRIAFYFKSDPSGSAAGWFIDDISVQSGAYEDITTQVHDFEKGTASWLDYGDWTIDNGTVWAIGDPFGGRKPHGGSKCLGTDLDGHYHNNAAARLISPTFTVPSDNARLRFWQDMDIEPGDTGYVQISVNQGAWTTLPSNSRYSGVTQQWTYATVDLSSYANQNVRIAFCFKSDPSSNAAGWFIDDIRVEVNHAPVLQPIGNKTVTEGGLLTFDVKATDPDNDPLTYSASPLPQGAILYGSTGYFSWRPSAGQVGTDTITFSASDGQLADSETITITVLGKNRAPVLDHIPNKTVYVDDTLAFCVHATDQDGDSLKYSASPLPPGATIDTTTGCYSWRPSAEQVGTHTITFRVSDGHLTDQQQVAMTVLKKNHAPVIERIADTTVYVGDALAFCVRATDPDGDTLKYSASPLPLGAILDRTGCFSWRPTAQQIGVYEITFTVTDGQATESHVVRITVNLRDTTGPSFEVDLLTNPVLPFELDLYIFPSEPLGSLPVVTITDPSGTSNPTVVQLSNRAAIGYLAEYQIEHSGSHTIQACGNDTASNDGCSDDGFAASKLFANTGADLVSTTGTFGLKIAAGSTSADGLVLCRERQIRGSDLANADLPADVTPIMVVELKSTVMVSGKPALLTINPAAKGLSVEAGKAVVLVPTARSGQRPIQTRLDAVTGVYVAEINELGRYFVGISDADKQQSLPVGYRLDQNTPNPFNGATTIQFSISEQSQSTLEVFNVLGQKVATLLDGNLLPGVHSLTWDGKSANGAECSSGIYFYRLTAGAYSQTRKMLYLK